jgi:hypothetical protein
MAIFAYGRVSTKEQTADNQRIEIEAAGHQVDFWFADTISGKTSASQRPQFAALLGQIRNGETLIVSKLDRHSQAAGRAQDIRDRSPTGKARPGVTGGQNDADHAGGRGGDGARPARRAHASRPGAREERRQDTGPPIQDDGRTAVGDRLPVPRRRKRQRVGQGIRRVAGKHLGDRYVVTL